MVGADWDAESCLICISDTAWGPCRRALKAGKKGAEALVLEQIQPWWEAGEGSTHLSSTTYRAPVCVASSLIRCTAAEKGKRNRAPVCSSVVSEWKRLHCVFAALLAGCGPGALDLFCACCSVGYTQYKMAMRGRQIINMLGTPKLAQQTGNIQ